MRIPPPSLPGLALSLADKLDSLVGLFGVGASPTGSADPFGLRRAALGIVNSLIATETRFSVRAGLTAAAALQPIPVSDEALQETATFVTRRLEGVLGDLGYAHDVVEAVLAARWDDPVAAVAACRALADAVAQPAWGETFTAYARTARITRQLDEQLTLNPAAYVEGVEQQLHDACVTAAAAMHAAGEPADLLWPTLRDLREPINAYFARQCWSTPKTPRCAPPAWRSCSRSPRCPRPWPT
jgi:glycyl-tRNA synthetase